MAGLSVDSGNWTTSPLNPAIAFGICVCATFEGNIGNLNWAWIFLTFSWIGSPLAVLCYEYGFKKFQDTVLEREEHEDEKEALLADDAEANQEPLVA